MSRFHPTRCALALAFLLPLLAPAAVRAADDDVVEKMSGARLGRILTDLELEFDEVQDDAYLFLVEGSKVVLFNKGETMQLYHGIADLEVSLERINEFNRDYRFTRAYIDREGDPVLESDIELTGGVTELNVKEWVRTYRAVLQAFHEHIQE